MHPTTRSGLSQVKSCSAVLCQGLVQGMAIGWTSPGLAKLRSGQAPFQPTLEELTWIASLFDLGLIVGVLASAVVFARLGRRQTVLVGPVSFSAWILLTYFAKNPAMLCLARLLAGAGQGVAMSFSFIYIAEVATPRLRGALILTVTLLLPLGQLAAFLLGPVVSYDVQSLYPTPLIALTFVLIFVWMQESPFHLAALGRKDDLVRVVRELRGGASPEEVTQEADSISRAVSQQLHTSESWREVFSTPGSKRAALIVLVESGSLALAGVTTVLSFTMQIFQAAGTSIQPELCSSLLVALKVCMVVVAIVLIEQLGRRMQLCLACIVNSVAMTTVCVFFLARDVYLIDVSDAAWTPIAALFIFIAASGVGVNAVPQVLMSELLNQRAKAVVAPMAITIVSLTSFALSKSFLLLGASVGFFLPFGFFALANALVALFTFTIVPETRGKTLGEVQEMLAAKSKDPRRDMTAGRAASINTYVFPSQPDKTAV